MKIHLLGASTIFRIFLFFFPVCFVDVENFTSSIYLIHFSFSICTENLQEQTTTTTKTCLDKNSLMSTSFSTQNFSDEDCWYREFPMKIVIHSTLLFERHFWSSFLSVFLKLSHHSLNIYFNL